MWQTLETKARFIQQVMRGETSVRAAEDLDSGALTYAELEPFYDSVEYEIGVSGKAGNIHGKTDPAGNIFEGPRGANIQCRPCATPLSPIS